VTLAVTFDVDWAPDWAILDCANICARCDVPATFFMTHDSGATRDIVSDARFAAGIHPNFEQGSTQGDSFESILENLMNLVPCATSFRTHGLLQSGRILRQIRRLYPRLTTDLSAFAPGHVGLAPFLHWLSEDVSVLRIPYFWQDDVAAFDPCWSWTTGVGVEPGLRVYNFHPIHVALNISDIAPYRRLAANLGGRSLSTLTREEFPSKLEGDNVGVKDFLVRLVEEAGPFHSIPEIAEEAFGKLSMAS
jgi:hypothetical protein